MAFRAMLRQQSRHFPMIFDLITSITGTRSWMRSSESGTQIGTQMEREWSVNETQMERIYERVPNAFSVRLFLNSTVPREFRLHDNNARPCHITVHEIFIARQMAAECKSFK